MAEDRSRIVSFERFKRGIQMLMDSGEDSLFIWYSYGESWDRSPVTVDVHMHPEEDEGIVIFEGEGYFLHGPTPETVVKSPFKGPCFLFMPANIYHRVVITSEGSRESVLTYSKNGSIIRPFEKAIASAKRAKVVLADLKEVPLTEPSREYRPR